MTKTIKTPSGLVTETEGGIKIEETSDRVTIKDGEKIVYLNGKNKMGETGIFVDSNGLCSHERVKKYCEDCKRDSEK